MGKPVSEGFVGEPSAEFLKTCGVERWGGAGIAKHREPVGDQRVWGDHHPHGHWHKTLKARKLP